MVYGQTGIVSFQEQRRFYSLYGYNTIGRCIGSSGLRGEIKAPCVELVRLKIYGSVKNVRSIEIGRVPFIVIAPVRNLINLGSSKASGPCLIHPTIALPR